MTVPTQITFDEKMYDVEAIQKAAYRSVNAFTIDINIADGKINCLLKPNISASEAGFAHGVEEFRKDVLDQQLRIKLKAETEPVRNLILGIAFSNTGLQGGE